MNKATLLKSNRLLGAQLVECGLLSLRGLEAASIRLMELMGQGNVAQMSLLRILLEELHAVDESRLLTYQIEHRNVSGLSLRNYAIDHAQFQEVELDEMWETWTLPVDFIGGVWFLASAYYMSPFVRRYWADKLQTEIVWYVAPLADLQTAIEAAAATREALAPQRAAV